MYRFSPPSPPFDISRSLFFRMEAFSLQVQKTLQKNNVQSQAILIGHLRVWSSPKKPKKCGTKNKKEVTKRCSFFGVFVKAKEKKKSTKTTTITTTTTTTTTTTERLDDDDDDDDCDDGFGDDESTNRVVSVPLCEHAR